MDRDSARTGPPAYRRCSRSRRVAGISPRGPSTGIRDTPGSCWPARSSSSSPGYPHRGDLDVSGPGVGRPGRTAGRRLSCKGWGSFDSSRQQQSKRLLGLGRDATRDGRRHRRGAILRGDPDPRRYLPPRGVSERQHGAGQGPALQGGHAPAARRPRWCVRAHETGPRDARALPRSTRRPHGSRGQPPGTGDHPLRAGRTRRRPRLHERALPQRERIYTEQRPFGYENWAISLEELGILHALRGDPEKGGLHLEKAMSMYRNIFDLKSYPSGHRDLYRCLLNIGSVKETRDDHAGHRKR